MKSNRQIVLNAGRVHQIERLAQLRETSIAGAVESLVADRVTAGEIKPGFPGFGAVRQGTHVLLVIDGKDLAPIATATAAEFGAELKQLAMRPTGAASLDLPDGMALNVRRNGRGFTISAGGARLTVSRSMLAEIGEQILELSR